MLRFSRLLLLALLAIVIGFYPLLAPTPHRIDQAHFELIQGGMTRADVEAIFGVPAGKYDWAEPELIYFSLKYVLSVRGQAQTVLIGGLKSGRFMLDEPNVTETWCSRHGVFTVRFSASGTVVSTGGPQSVRIAPPWQRWWKAIWER